MYGICLYSPVLRVFFFWLAIIGLCFGQLFHLGPNLLTLFYVKYSCIVLYIYIYKVWFIGMLVSHVLSRQVPKIE